MSTTSPGQEIPLAMHQAETIVVRAHQPQRLTQIIGTSQALGEERGRKLLHTEGEHAHGDGAYLPMPHPHGITLMGDHTHGVALFQAVGHRSHGSGEHPRVETPQAFVFASLEAYLR